MKISLIEKSTHKHKHMHMVHSHSCIRFQPCHCHPHTSPSSRPESRTSSTRPPRWSPVSTTALNLILWHHWVVSLWIKGAPIKLSNVNGALVTTGDEYSSSIPIIIMSIVSSQWFSMITEASSWGRGCWRVSVSNSTAIFGGNSYFMLVLIISDSTSPC